MRASTRTTADLLSWFVCACFSPLPRCMPRIAARLRTAACPNARRHPCIISRQCSPAPNPSLTTHDSYAHNGRLMYTHLRRTKINPRFSTPHSLFLTTPTTAPSAPTQTFSITMPSTTCPDTGKFSTVGSQRGRAQTTKESGL